MIQERSGTRIGRDIILHHSLSPFHRWYYRHPMVNLLKFEKVEKRQKPHRNENQNNPNFKQSK